jgi:DNA-binding MarR family transcriptional regulator
MEENGSNGNAEIPRLRELAEFRFHLRQFLSFSDVSSEKHGIQAQQYQLLQVVAAAPHDLAASVSYLADRMILRHNSAVELVDRAERAGLVRRHRDEGDLRRTIIKLTPNGERLLRSLVAEHVTELERLGDRISIRFARSNKRASFPVKVRAALSFSKSDPPGVAYLSRGYVTRACTQS